MQRNTCPQLNNAPALELELTAVLTLVLLVALARHGVLAVGLALHVECNEDAK